ncbi:MAG: hypothetical protein OEV74_13330 [Cyclobacteriaceae bacterium]|nr:hypothetical protein [Cyclobacteriaceae bacterium]
MKTCLLLFVPVVFSITVAAQDVVPEVATFNFLEPEGFIKYKTARHGSKIVVRIQNVNRNLYKINESFTQSDFNTELPNIFSAVNLPGYLNLLLPDAFENVMELSLLPSLVNRKIEIDRNLKIIYASSEFINSTTQYNNILSNLYQSCGIAYDAIEHEAIETTEKFLPAVYPKTRVEQAKGLKAELETAIQKAVGARTAIQERIPEYMNDIDRQMEKNGDVIWEWDKFPLDKKHPDYSEGLIRYRMAKKENEAYKTQKDSASAVLKGAFALVVALEKFMDDNKIQALVNNYNLINESNFTYATDTLRVSGDEVKLKISINATKALPCEDHNKLVIEETYRTQGGWKVDFSAGLLFNGGNADFLGNEFQYRTINDSTAFIQRKDGGSRLLLSVGAFMHIYRRSGTNFNVAISPGLSTTTAFDGLNFHLGGSAIFGRRERLVLSVGATAREVKVLDHHYRLDESYLITELPSAPPTVKVFPKFGWFVSMTYNWSKLKS